MERRLNHLCIFFFLLISSSFFNGSNAAKGTRKHNHLSAKSLVIRYWNTHINKHNPKSSFLLSKASPLTASQLAYLTKLAAQKTLSSHLNAFCSLANLFCFNDQPNKAPFPQGKGNNTNGINPASKRPEADSKGSGIDNSNGQGFQNYDASFAIYGINGNNTNQSFKDYADETNFGHLFFKDYSKEGGTGAPSFANYAGGSHTNAPSFTGYGEPAVAEEEEEEEEEEGGGSGSATIPESARNNGNRFRKLFVQPGKYFREAELKEGNVMPIPDIRDRMPVRSFLPKSIATLLPFSTSRLREIKEIFNASDKSAMEYMIAGAIAECERPPSPGETKRCVGSIEEMIDFATLVLGRNVVVRNTRNVNGYMTNVIIGSAKAIQGGNITKAVSCHQHLYPYLVYYCHSVPKVRVYEADILDANSKKKINHGVAICHLDTSVWSPRHEAFIALGSGPGKIEVCHWLFENDMIWTVAN